MFQDVQLSSYHTSQFCKMYNNGIILRIFEQARFSCHILQTCLRT